MFIQGILFSFFFQYCLTIKNHSNGICHKRNLCPKKNEVCHPVVIKCGNSSCRYRRFETNDNQQVMFSRWFYDSNYQRCRRYDNHIENFVYFRFLRDCKRLCPVIRQQRNEKIVSLHIFDTPANYNDTLYVHLYVDFSPNWVQRLVDWMNVSTQNYNAQVHYFQNYRRRFANFVDPSYQLMLNQQQSLMRKND